MTRDDVDALRKDLAQINSKLAEAYAEAEPSPLSDALCEAVEDCGRLSNSLYAVKDALPE